MTQRKEEMRTVENEIVVSIGMGMEILPDKVSSRLSGFACEGRRNPRCLPHGFKPAWPPDRWNCQGAILPLILLLQKSAKFTATVLLFEHRTAYTRAARNRIESQCACVKTLARDAESAGNQDYLNFNSTARYGNKLYAV